MKDKKRFLFISFYSIVFILVNPQGLYNFLINPSFENYQKFNYPFLLLVKNSIILFFLVFMFIKIKFYFLELIKIIKNKLNDESR